MLREHGVEDRDQPVFEGAVVVVWYDEVVDAVQTLCAEGGAGCLLRDDVCRGEAFDKVFFDPAGGRHDGVDVFVLDQPAKSVAQPRGYEIRGVAEEDGGPLTSLWVFPGALGHISAMHLGLGESIRRLTMSLMISAARPSDEAWKPTLRIELTNSAAEMSRSVCRSKLGPVTGTASSGTPSDGISTASAAEVGLSEAMAVYRGLYERRGMEICRKIGQRVA